MTIFLGAFSNCSKKMSQLSVAKVPFTYSVTAQSGDFIVQQYVDTLIHIKLSISTTGGISDTVTLTPYIVPKGITFIESSSTGLPDFSWTFAIKVAIDSPGNYPVSIRTSSPSGDTKYLDFNFIVTPDSFCALTLAGNYRGNTTCSPGVPLGGIDNNVQIIAYNDKAIVEGSSTPSFNLTPVCGTGNLFFSSNLSGAGVTINETSGTFTNDTILLNYQVIENTGLFDGTCQTVLTR